MRAEINAALGGMKIKAAVEGRPKHYCSIYQKMIVRGRDFDDIYDLVGVRILCRARSRLLRRAGRGAFALAAGAGPVQGLHRHAQFSMYQSLHTTVVGPEGKPLEVQIRTRDMHRTAEYGIAAHWRYKEVKGRNGVPHPQAAAEIDDMAWMRQLLDWQREAADPGEFLDSLRYDLAVQEIFVFTPKGDVITLPAGSTPVDFAYAVHTEVGHRCIGARVNGRLVALERKLENGEVVEVFTSKAPNAGPSRDWQTFVVSPRAKAKIRQWFAKERREEALEAGKDAIAREVRKRRPCRCSGCSMATRCRRWPRNCATPTCRRSTRRSARVTSRRGTWCSGCWPSSAGPRSAEEEIAETVHAGDHAECASAAPTTPASRPGRRGV